MVGGSARVVLVHVTVEGALVRVTVDGALVEQIRHEDRRRAAVVRLVDFVARGVGRREPDWFALHVEGDETILAVRAELLVLRALVLAPVGHALEAGVLHRAVVLSELLSKVSASELSIKWI